MSVLCADGSTMPMDFVDQFRDVLRTRELRNTVAEIEDMAREIAEAVEHGARLGANHGWRREQYQWIDVALERDPIAHFFARLAQVHGPVEPDRVHADCRDLFQPQT